MPPSKGNVHTSLNSSVVDDNPRAKLLHSPGDGETGEGVEGSPSRAVPEQGNKYYSAGGGEVKLDGSLSSLFTMVTDYVFEENRRPNYSNLLVKGADFHNRPPEWMEYKNAAIDGTVFTDAQLAQDKTHWTAKYKEQLDVGEAIQQVKRQRRFETDHDLVGAYAQLRRWLGLAPPLDEKSAQQHVKNRYRLEAEVHRLHDKEAGEGEREESFPIGVLPRESLVGGGDGGEQLRAAAASKGTMSLAWKALMESVETGKPLSKVANEYRPRVDFYGLDPFLDSAPSFVWFCTKVGIFVGLLHGTAKAMQAINVDVQFLKASGVGVLSVLNMSVFASVVKWGGSTMLFSLAFCFGDRTMRQIKRRTLPPHDANRRSTSNYALGLAVAGSTAGVMPWWVLSDVGLASRMAGSGFVLGGVLGMGVGMALNRLIALNTARLDATNRQLRRYEALMLRERKWAEAELQRHESTEMVWW